ncbi:MAG: hypothetical protein ABI439_04980 [Rhodospirillales bacterium]
MKKKFAYPLVISLATLTCAIGLAACNDNSSPSNQAPAAATPTNPATGAATSGNSANPAGNRGSANPGGTGAGGSGSR